MLRKNRKRSFFSALVLLGGLLVSYRTWQIARFAQRQTFPDGSTIQFRGVTTGPHEMVFGTLMGRILDRLLPRWVMIPTNVRLVQFPFAVPAGTPPLDTNALVMWFDFQAAPEHPDSFFRAVVMDGDAPMEVSRTWSRWHLAPAVPLEVFPRQRKAFKVRVFETHPGFGPWEQVAEFKISNPRTIQPVPWPTESFPIVRRIGEWEIRVLEVGTKNWGQEAKALRLAPGLSTFVRFTARRGDEPSSAWAPVSISVADGTGNSFTNALAPSWDPPVWKVRGAQTLIWFPGTLSASAAAWRVRLTLAREGDFRPDETWTLRKVLLPGPGDCVSADLATNVGGGTLRFLGLAGLETPCDLRRDLEWNHRFSRGVHAGFSPLRSNKQLTSLRIIDVSGHSFPEDRSSFPTTGGTAENVFDFMVRLPENTGAVDLTFGVGEVQILEFTVKPISPQIISTR